MAAAPPVHTPLTVPTPVTTTRLAMTRALTS